ncbi:F-box/FBD/LRR-repeat protein At1g16930 [Brassica napus]|uniref:F-box/FBD/LRR-repeat protein At1g16930 n=1 Tax=Brassica napus TaxID=3708 RepID=UPI00207AB7F7|nr:F-box/FBD/LRR-repeat protein At1g16930 [Brassica napus]
MEKRFATQRKEEEEEATQILTIYQIRCFVPVFDLLLASCPVLEMLTVIRDRFELLETMSVRSKSLISFALGIEDYEVGLLGDDHVVEIDAPRLEHMSLCDHLSGSIIIHSIAPSALVKIDVNFDGKDRYALLYQDYDDDDDDDDSNSKRTMIRNFLTRISTVCGMEISSVTLQVRTLMMLLIQ